MNMQSIKQIELTTECNLKCRYCPHPKMQRPKEHMKMDTFGHVLRWINYFNAMGTQGEVSLTGIGEPLMHPDLEEMIKLLRVVHKGKVIFSTNGILMTQEIGEFLKAYDVHVYVSTHRPEVAKPAIDICRKLGILDGVNTSFATSALDWAGQVDWEVSAPTITCDFLKQGWGVVLFDGQITTCCIDAENMGVIGNVKDKVECLQMKPFELCESCNMIVPDELEVQLYRKAL